MRWRAGMTICIPPAQADVSIGMHERLDFLDQCPPRILIADCCRSKANSRTLFLPIPHSEEKG
jgi:hypothetical protein